MLFWGFSLVECTYLSIMFVYVCVCVCTSELVLGLGNRLRRHKRAGSGDLNLLPPKKRTKLCEQGVETRPHEVARLVDLICT